MIIFILRSDKIGIYKTAWIIPMLIAPVFGGLFYLFFKPINYSRKRYQKELINAQKRKEKLAPYIKETIDIPSVYQKQIEHISHEVWPYYENTKITFLGSGEEKLTKVIEKLEAAKKSIFIEYFILEERGEIWKAMWPILLRKIDEGVDIKLIYDDFGCSMRIHKGFKKRLERAGIETVVFNPLRIRANVAANYRDHKKIIIVDSNVAFTGGINIADEYANIKNRFGHWHDAAIMIEGDAVFSLTATFFETWDLYKDTDTDYTPYIPDVKVESDGVVMPFTDSPLDNNHLNKSLFTQMIFSAKKKIFITSPYFVVDTDLINTLKIQALSGVEIHIIVPGIPDKRYVYVVTKYYLKHLANMPNVYIHKYEPGFIHSKILYIDDEVAAVGTCNFDFRSFYLHYENTVWFYNSSSLVDIKKYLLDTIDKSRLFTYKELNHHNFIYKVYQSLLVGVSHLL